MVDHQDQSKLDHTQAREVQNALDNLRAIDPACGSGAYLLGLLQEIVLIYLSLLSDKLKKDSESLFKLKQKIIKNNLYGIDNDRFAVNIAMLRLWLSLTVESENPIPLPNLDFKIECGDSLTGPSLLDTKQTEQTELGRSVEITQYGRMKAQYLDRSFEGSKVEFRKEIQEKRDLIVSWTNPGRKAKGFDWQAEFAEVFLEKESLTTIGGELNFGQELAQLPEPGGFDIVLANPPYVRQELIKELKPELKKIFPEVYTGIADLYCYFYARAIQLLKRGGMLAFISSNKWFRANYGSKLRGHISKTCQVKSITDFGDLPVFEGATAYSMIFLAEKRTTDNPEQDAAETVVTEPKSLDPPYPNVLEVVSQQGRTLADGALSGANWLFADQDTAKRLRQMRDAGTPLGKYVGGRIYYGIKTGFNKAFVIDGDTRQRLIDEDPRSEEVIKPLAMGKNIRRWNIKRQDRWLIFTRRGTQIDDFDAVKSYLGRWKDQLLPKPADWPESKPWAGRKHGSYKWYEIQDEIAYHPEFEKPKIVFPDIAVNSQFAYDVTGIYLGNTAYIMPDCDVFLLGILNSRPVEEFYRDVSAQVRGGYLRFIRQYVEQIPIPDASESERNEISSLVQKCLDAKGVDCEEWESEIDERVVALYGL